jgi:hypothetical protein
MLAMRREIPDGGKLTGKATGEFIARVVAKPAAAESSWLPVPVWKVLLAWREPDLTQTLVAFAW